MNFSSNLLEKCKLYDPIQKGHFLAEAINNSNKDNLLLANKENSDDWVNVAMTLLDDPDVPTEYIPIRDIIKCLERGNIGLAIKLHHCGHNNELHYRAIELLNELSLEARGNKQGLAQVNEANHLFCIITFLKNLHDLKEHGFTTYEIKNMILADLMGQASLDQTLDMTSIEQNINFILSQELSIKENVIKTLPYLRKIVLNSPLSMLQDITEPKGFDDQKPHSCFPYDIVQSADGKVNIALTLGFDEKLFAELQNRDAISDDCNKALMAPPLIKKTSYRILHDSTKNLLTSHKSFKNFVEKPSSFKNLFSFRGLKHFDFGSVKNFIDLPETNSKQMPAGSSRKMSILSDLEGIQECSEDEIASQSLAKFSNTSMTSGLKTSLLSGSLTAEMSETFSIDRKNGGVLKDQHKKLRVETGANKNAKLEKAETKTSDVGHQSNTIKSKGNVVDKTPKQEHVKHAGGIHNWFSQKFFKGSKVAVTDDADQHKATIDEANSFYRRDTITTNFIPNIEEVSKGTTKLYDIGYEADDSAIYNTTMNITGENID